LGGRIRWVNWHLPTIENKYTDDDFHNSEYDTAGVIGRRAREVGISQTVQLRSGQRSAVIRYPSVSQQNRFITRALSVLVKRCASIWSCRRVRA